MEEETLNALTIIYKMSNDITYNLLHTLIVDCITMLVVDSVFHVGTYRKFVSKSMLVVGIRNTSIDYADETHVDV